jgi:hypothetical protein
VERGFVTRSGFAMQKTIVCLFGTSRQSADPGALASRRRVVLEFTLWRAFGNKLKLELQLAAETAALPGLASASFRLFQLPPRWDGNKVESVNFRRTFIRTCLMCAVMLPAVVQAQLSYMDNGDGTATITGCDQDYSGAVTIPDTTNGLMVSSIGDGAFYGCTNLTSSTIPNSITNIGTAAFNSCLSLTNIAIPASVTSIGEYAFFYCTNLTAIEVNTTNPAYSSADGVLFNKDQTILMQFPFGKAGSYAIPGTVTNLADGAFGINHGPGPYPSLVFSCYGLTNLVVPGSIANIKECAFSYCAGLISVTLSNGIASIGDGAFSWCYQLSSINIPGSVTNIGVGAFFWSGLTNVTIENGVSSIGERAFEGCFSLKSVTIPGSVTNIGDYAFFSCSGLVNFNLPNGVSRLGADAFAGCVDLPHIEIPDCLTSIGQEAFSFCYALTNVTIPSSVTNIGPYAFATCLSLANIYVDTNNAFYGSVDGILCSKDQTVLIQFPGTGRGDNYTVPSGITSIGSYSFANNFFVGCYSVPSGGNNNFPGTNSPGPVPVGPFLPPAGTNLVSVIIPSSVTNIGNGAFVFLQNLKGVYFAGNAPAITESLVPSSLFGSSGGLFRGGSVSAVYYLLVYYLPGTNGWDATYGGVPTAPWLPAMQTTDTNFGGQTNQFGFNIQWASGQTVVVEASTNLIDWQPLQTNTLTASPATFSDLEWTNYPGRFYRLRSP